MTKNLSEAYSCYEVEGYQYIPADILRKMDEHAYRQGFNEYVDTLKDELSRELLRMDVGSSDSFFGAEVECCEDDEDEEAETSKQPAAPVEPGVFGDLLFNEL